MGVEVERKWARADYREPGQNNGHNLVQIKNAAAVEEK